MLHTFKALMPEKYGAPVYSNEPPTMPIRPAWPLWNLLSSGGIQDFVDLSINDFSILLYLLLLPVWWYWVINFPGFAMYWIVLSICLKKWNLLIVQFDWTKDMIGVNKEHTSCSTSMCFCQDRILSIITYYTINKA